MKNEKFLTVFAVFDEKTQEKMKKYQNEILKTGLVGTQTMDIPFHISLGSFPTEREKELTEKIKEVGENFEKFSIKLNKIENFNKKVLFIEPIVNKKLQSLQQCFANNYADGLPWHAHSTIFIGDEKEFVVANRILNNLFSEFEGQIVELQMGEFFPTRMITKKKLK